MPSAKRLESRRQQESAQFQQNMYRALPPQNEELFEVWNLSILVDIGASKLTWLSRRDW
jgi:hypothetical protein